MSARPDNLSSHLREAISTLNDLRQERDELLRQRNEPIAIIGMGCRLPGGGNDPESFWAALLQGIDAVREIPAHRWAPGTPQPTLPGTRWAGLLDQIDLFDASFFGLSPRESMSLDPQQRLLLEVTWEALENAGQPTDQLLGSRTGVFVGMMNLDYRDWIKAANPTGQDPYGATGNALCTAAGRIAYILGLQGPCMSVDTACSSSLVAVHLACQSLRSGESTTAIVGGVNLIASALTMQLVASTQALSPDGRCRTFDARANGTARAEGCGVVILKRLSEARRAGDRILALIRGSAVNHDGQSTGFTAPSVMAQQLLLRQALDSAQVAPNQIDYLEAHGTGTALGDPIEMEALKAVLGQPRPDGSECTVSSVKTNLGHLEAAAGITGLIKTVLVLQHQRVPRHLHFSTLNPRISLVGTPFVIPTAERSWPAGQGPRFAGISSFGLSGTNAHAVLETAPQPDDRQPANQSKDYVLILTGKTESALRALAEKYHVFLAKQAPDISADLPDIAYTASVRRAHYSHRLTVVGQTKQEWLKALSAFGSARSSAGLAYGQAPTGRPPKLVFVFSGQGSQWLGMGKQLLVEEPVFGAAIADCEQAIQKEAGWSLTKELLAEPGQSNLARSEVMQPMIFAVAVGLAKLYRSWGVKADAVIGHSMGEVASAHICGALSLADAVRIICRRSILMQKMSGLGAVAQIDASVSEVEQLLVEYEERISVAGSNGPRSTVVSGEVRAVEAFLVDLQDAGVFCRRVRMDVASHSRQMEPLRDGLLTSLEGIRSQKPQIRMYSTVTSEEVEEGQLDAAYWYRNMREPVQLWPTVERLRAQGYELFLEVGPHPVLAPTLQDGFRQLGTGGVALATLRREQPERRCLQETLGEIYVRGCEVAWAALYPASAQCVSLPTYPWQRERHWLETPAAPHAARRSAATAGAAAHALLGEPLSVSTQPSDRFWEQRIRLEDLPYLRDHRLQGEVLFPGAGYVEMALAAARQLRPGGGFALEGMRFERMLILSENKDTIVQTVVTAADTNHAELRIFCWEGEQWSRHATATLRWESGNEPPCLNEEYLTAVKGRCLAYTDGSQHYKHMAKLGVECGPSFQGVRELWTGEGEGLAHVVLPHAVWGQLDTYELHPAWLDACLQPVTSGMTRLPGQLLVAAGFERVERYRAPDESAWIHWTIEQDEDGATTELLVLTTAGQPILRVHGVRIQRVSAGSSRPREVQQQWLYEVQWRKQALPQAGSAPATGNEAGLLFMSRGNCGDTVRKALLERGGRWVQVEPGEQYQRIGADQYQLDPTDSESFHTLLREAFGDKGCTAIMHMWSLDCEPDEQPTSEQLARAQSVGCRSALNLVQAVLRSGWRRLPRVWLVTRGSQAVIDQDTVISVAQAPLWGLGQAVAREHPELSCTRVDLSASAAPAEVENLAREFQAMVRDEQVALRGTERYLARLVRADVASAPAQHPVQASGTYLISGGLSGLGLEAAETLGLQGAKYLALLGRRMPDERARKVIARLQELGTEVVAAQVDVAKYDEVAALVAKLAEKWPPIRGVIHSAAVLDDGIILEQTWDRFERVMGPKMYGVWNLHLATLTQPLDFFIGYSSAASLLGVPGQVNYIAASAFVDALAYFRQRTNRCGLSVNWGAITEVGIGIRVPEVTQRLADRGMHSLTQAETNQVLAYLLGESHQQLGVMKLDRRLWVSSFPHLADSSYWAELLSNADPEQLEGQTPKPDWLRQLLAADAEDRHKLMDQLLKERLSEVLRLKLPLIDQHTPFLKLGFDSLMAVELRNRIDAELQVIVPIGYLLKDANLARLTAYVLERLPESTAANAYQEEIEEGDV